MEKIILKFIKGYETYIPGDLAGFVPEQALGLIKTGVAVFPDNNPKAEAIAVGLWTKRMEARKKTNKIICPICGTESKTKGTLASHKASQHNLPAKK